MKFPIRLDFMLRSFRKCFGDLNDSYVSGGAPIKSEQKKMLEKYNKKRLEFETDVEGHQAEGLVGSLMIDNSNESAALAIKDSAQTTRTDA